MKRKCSSTRCAGCSKLSMQWSWSYWLWTSTQVWSNQANWLHETSWCFLEYNDTLCAHESMPLILNPLLHWSTMTLLMSYAAVHSYKFFFPPTFSDSKLFLQCGHSNMALPKNEMKFAYFFLRVLSISEQHINHISLCRTWLFCALCFPFDLRNAAGHLDFRCAGDLDVYPSLCQGLQWWGYPLGLNFWHHSNAGKRSTAPHHTFSKAEVQEVNSFSRPSGHAVTCYAPVACSIRCKDRVIA